MTSASIRVPAARRKPSSLSRLVFAIVLAAAGVIFEGCASTRSRPATDGFLVLESRKFT